MFANSFHAVPFLCGYHISIAIHLFRKFTKAREAIKFFCFFFQVIKAACIRFLRTLPHYMFIYRFIHTPKWLDKEGFQVSDKSRQVVLTVHLPEEKASMQLLPKTMGLPELVKEVAMAAADDM